MKTGSPAFWARRRRHEQAPGLPRDPPTIPHGGLVMVIGESHHQDALAQLTGGPRGDGFQADCTAQLVPEPSNRYDSAALMVTIGGSKVGYLDRVDAHRYRPLVDQAIATSGRATVAARITGGWDRGGGDIGMFGVELFCADQPSSAAQPGADEFRLRGGSTVSVSNEEHYQATLTALVTGAGGATSSYPAVAELVEAEKNPHTNSKDPVLEVRVDGSTVGFLTPAMSERFQRVVAAASAQQKRLTCAAQIFHGAKGRKPVIEIRLSACPLGVDEEYVVDPSFALITDLVRGKRARVIHQIAGMLPDGSYRTMCGTTVGVDGAVLYASTKPWVGAVELDTHKIIPADTLCRRC